MAEVGRGLALTRHEMSTSPPSTTVTVVFRASTIRATELRPVSQIIIIESVDYVGMAPTHPSSLNK